MRIFDYHNHPKMLITSEVVRLLGGIREYKGKQEILIETVKTDILRELVHIATIQSVDASNRIEGIYTSNKRLKDLVDEKTTPINRSEQEILGYRQVLKMIHDSYSYISLSQNHILQLHRDLLASTGERRGGEYKNQDNYIMEYDYEGNQRVRFNPMPAHLTEIAMEELCQAFNIAISQGEYEALILIPMFIVDFLCIHPFNDGNGRMSRLLTVLLLYKAEYFVGKYISIEKIIEESKDLYYQALYDSSIGWLEGENDYLPFIKYFLGVLMKACHEFDKRIALVRNSNNKGERIMEFIDQKIGKFTKQEILETCPDISESTVMRKLKELVKEGYIKPIDASRPTAYVKK